ncbi:Rhodanese-related sulfurtransferase [Rhodoblastus acidophilus]|uniref:Rhodanese-related sulfurtransferase n=1 Tax=Rhodoblastus acidophilus TaxID=1074 RepID=A0A212QM07_RHOAC|nr:rhodanese-like domain-containing protein [Rhodoblastus acidophilus]PPQ39830.1 rhodanese-like domain-containing protein [Rhodoblastus acidophilus]RAI23806.1 rhodanese-like domain-containing protein [Rhodoblastus acidophilus]SNB60268.1 Rhodanese-related sulfurtransferase [Rhodoblastus acidophilus]
MFGWLFGGGGDVKTFNPGELRDLLREKDSACLLVDVREDREWAGGRIPGAVHAPLSRFEQAAAGLPKDKPLVFYCASGMRSKTALRRARDMGLIVEGHLGGGLMNWARYDYPVVR